MIVLLYRTPHWLIAASREAGDAYGLTNGRSVSQSIMDRSGDSRAGLAAEREFWTWSRG